MNDVIFSTRGVVLEGTESEIREAASRNGLWLASDGKWYSKGYGPVRGGWGEVGLFGNGRGPVYRNTD